jgi:hypothetical protein
MPQPLSRVKSDASYSLANTGDYPMRGKDALGRLAMEAIMSWSNVELFMLQMYVSLAGGKESDAAAVFLALENNSAKTTVISTLIERRGLKSQYVALFRAIIKLVKEKQKNRDKLAHWVWGNSPQLPDALLLANPRVLVKNDFGLNGEDVKSSIFVYREQEFQQIIADNENLAQMCFHFKWIIDGHISNSDDSIYHKLCIEPEIQEILNRNI